VRCVMWTYQRRVIGNWGIAYLSQMGLTVATEGLSEQMTALKDFSIN
jgi:hypothetical protein